MASKRTPINLESVLSKNVKVVDTEKFSIGFHSLSILDIKRACSDGMVQSSNLGGSPKPVACKIVHGRIK